MTIGHVSRPNGLRGAVVLQIDRSMTEVLSGGLEVDLVPRSGPPLRTRVRSAAPVRGGVRVTFDGVGDRNASEALVGATVLVDRASLGLADDEYLDVDLVGLDVVASGGEEDANVIGRLVEVVATGANDVYVVRTPDGREVLVPAVEHAVLEIDLESRRMTVAAEALEYGTPEKPDRP